MSETTKEESEKIQCFNDQEREAAQNAAMEFEKKNYINCLQHLSKLESKDFKVLHNKHVAEFHKGNLMNVDAFLSNLLELFNQFALNPDKIEDVDYCLAFFNLAVVYYHQKQYMKSLRILEKIYKFIEPMEEQLSKNLGLLLVELYLCLKQVEKAFTLITYLNSNWIQGENSKGNGGKNEKKAQLKTNDEFAQSLERYKVKFLLLSHKMKLAKAEIKVLADGNKNKAEVLFLTANYLYLQGKFEESMQTLGQISKDALQKYSNSGESANIFFYNNMGAIHHAMGKFNLACFYYREALKEDGDLKDSHKQKSLFSLGISKYHELMFNLGVSLLHAGKASQAFDCLIIAVRRYHKNCRLWLRLAECCIQSHKPSNLVDFDKSRKQKEMIVDVLGSGENQKVILNTTLTGDRKYSCDSQSYAVPVPTLEFATLCLKNAKALMGTEPETAPVPLLFMSAANNASTAGNSCHAPSSPLCSEDRTMLENSILIATAYVSLCLGDYVVALENAKLLLAKNKISGAHKLLANLYAAECLVLQDKLIDAMEYLSPANIKNVELTLSDVEIDKDNEVKTYPPLEWFPNTTPSALAVLHYNMATVKTLSGQYGQAKALLKQIWQNQSAECKVPAQIIMLVLYIELQLGAVDEARNLIKQHSVHRRISG